MAFLDKMAESFRGVAKTVSRGRAAYIASAEENLRTERLKNEISDLREEKDQVMLQLAHRLYEQYTQGLIQDPDLLAICQNIKMLQWQIDERWCTINAKRDQDE